MRTAVWLLFYFQLTSDIFPPLFIESCCFLYFNMQRIIIQENTLPPLSIFTRREQLLSIICFQAGDLVGPHIWHPVICFPFSTKKKTNPPWPFMFHLHLWYMSNLSKTSKDSCGTNGASQTTPPPTYLLYACCTFFFYPQRSVIAGTWIDEAHAWWIALPCPLILPRWSNTPFVWLLHNVCRWLHHPYVAADVLLFGGEGSAVSIWWTTVLCTERETITIVFPPACDHIVLQESIQ